MDNIIEETHELGWKKPRKQRERKLTNKQLLTGTKIVKKDLTAKRLNAAKMAKALHANRTPEEYKETAKKAVTAKKEYKEIVEKQAKKELLIKEIVLATMAGKVRERRKKELEAEGLHIEIGDSEIEVAVRSLIKTAQTCKSSSQVSAFVALRDTAGQKPVEVIQNLTPTFIEVTYVPVVQSSSKSDEDDKYITVERG